MRRLVLRAADGLELHCTSSHWRVAWGERDWLGPLTLRLNDRGRWRESGEDLPWASLRRLRGRDELGDYVACQPDCAGLPLPVQVSVRAYRELPLLVFRLEARAALSGLASGSFAEPSVAWPVFAPERRLAGGVPSGTRSFGYQFAEFGLPVVGDDACRGVRLAPHRPAVAQPLLFIAPDQRTLMLAPRDGFHEQVIAIPADEGESERRLRCGWHGDLNEVPPGFATELFLWVAPSPRQALAEWGELLRKLYRTPQRSRYADPGLAKLSYWTDNGAHYYYRTEAGEAYTTTLLRVLDGLQSQGISVGALQLDSWFYPHETLPPVCDQGAEIVPPTGTTLWEPRKDLFPQGLGALHPDATGHPLILHSRHFSAHSPYFASEPAWYDGDTAHPQRASFFHRLLAQAANWGAITYEQDWLVESFLRVRGLREQPGRARAWQEGLNAAADAYGLTLQWCMASPADFLQTLTLPRVTSIRTSGDYRYLFDNGFHWYWFLCTNALARSLGLYAFKDVFLSYPPAGGMPGEPYAEIEALLAALSAGPVGIGDRRGATCVEVVRRTCRADGVLIKPDASVAAIDRCFTRHCFLEPELLVGETASWHPAGQWVYVVTLNAFSGRKTLHGFVYLADLGAARPRQPVLALDWRTRRWERLELDQGWEVRLDFQDWDFRVLCPLLPGEVAVFGDLSTYATAGSRRVEEITLERGALTFRVEGAQGERVAIHGWSAVRPRGVTVWSAGAEQAVAQGESGEVVPSWSWQDGVWCVRLDIPAATWAQVRLQLSN